MGSITSTRASERAAQIQTRPGNFVEARSQLRAIVQQKLRSPLIDCLFVKRAVFILQYSRHQAPNFRC